MPAIFLVGFMGSGKTTIGRELARRLGWRFRDLDNVIEAEQYATIAHIFDTRGEPAFREIETAALRRQLESAQSEDIVLALGGGVFAQPVNRQLLAGTDTVWLDCPFERAQARVAQDPNRPNARDPERFARLFAERLPAYSQARHRVTIESDDPSVAADAIIAQLGLSAIR